MSKNVLLYINLLLIYTTYILTNIHTCSSEMFRVMLIVFFTSSLLSSLSSVTLTLNPQRHCLN